jgi:glucose-6-phosphate dehydrogenase assembly protein OpcA
VTGVSVTAERISPSADLLGAWLNDRLRVPVSRHRSQGPGITEVVLTTRKGDIRVTRDQGQEGTLVVPGQPDRPVALRRRTVPELLTEELRRLDPDDVYAATVRRMHRNHQRSTAKKS